MSLGKLELLATMFWVHVDPASADVRGNSLWAQELTRVVDKDTTTILQDLVEYSQSNPQRRTLHPAITALHMLRILDCYSGSASGVEQ